MADILPPRTPDDPEAAAAARAHEIVHLQGLGWSWPRTAARVGLSVARARAIWLQALEDREAAARAAGYDMRPMAENTGTVDPEQGARAGGDPDTPGSGRELPP